MAPVNASGTVTGAAPGNRVLTAVYRALQAQVPVTVGRLSDVPIVLDNPLGRSPRSACATKRRQR